MSYDVIVIGGGQAGLAAGHFLARQGLRFTAAEGAAVQFADGTSLSPRWQHTRGSALVGWVEEDAEHIARRIAARAAAGPAAPAPAVPA